MKHPFAELIDLHVVEQRSGHSRCTLQVAEQHLNPHGVAHGAVLYALADTGMGAALYPTLAQGELCATIQITFNYFKAVPPGLVVCTTHLVNRGKRVAHLESKLLCGDDLVASASGSFSIFTPSGGPTVTPKA